MTATATILQRTAPREVLKLARDLERWRGSAQRGPRIPEALWAKAGRLARTYGVSRIAVALGLSYADLRRRARGEPGSRTGPPARPTFIQLAGPTVSPGLSTPGAVEVVHGSGARFILRLPEARPEDLLGLLRAFLDHRP
jgi:hypothetical protein